MKVYLAAMYSQKEEMKQYAADLAVNGVTVTSSWLTEPHSPNTQLHEIADTLLAEYALRDFADIREADGMIFFSQPATTPTLRGGRHVEFGYALALHKPIIVVGPKENIFHTHWLVQHAPDWGTALDLLLGHP